MLQPGVLRVLGLVSALALAAISPLSAQSQGGQLTGSVTSAETGQPLGAVQVYLEGTSRASITRTDGTFTIANIPPGTYTVVAQSIGYQQFRQSDISITANGSVSLNIQLVQSVLALQGIVATGLVDPVEGSRSPITVSQVTSEQLPVTAGSADPMTQLQGRVAGLTMSRSGGQPGQAAQVRLRTPTSALGTNRPLYVVDGVILGTDAVDIESSDIESIEVIKGAAAASLYGSRAASGVISITTNRGRGVAAGETRFRFNTEYGRTAPASMLKPQQHHQFATNANGELVDAHGNVVSWAERYEPANAIMDKPYPAEFEVYDNLQAIYRPGGFNSQNLTLTSNSENTNLAASVNRLHEAGAIEGNQGYERTAFRVNLDHRFRETVQLGLSTYHARTFRDDIGSGAPGGVGGLLGDFFRVPSYLDLTQKNDQGGYDRWAGDEEVYGVVIENPIFRQLHRDNERRAARTLANANVRWTPLHWLNVVGDLSFDREDRTQRIFVPKGIQDSNETYDGRIGFTNGQTDTFNGSLQASIRYDLGPLNSRTTVRGIIERVSNEVNNAEGRDFRVQDVESIDAAAIKLAGSSSSEIRSTGYLVDQAFDWDGKYILTILGRHDGSSLFGPDNRWHSYYRVAGAWRVSEEPWFNVAGVNEFKVKASRGTAGGRPNFSNQYETWSITDTGITKGTLGNRNLRPEHTTENEFGIEMILFDKIGVDLVHARQTTEHQLVNVDLPGAVGFTSQWINAGTLKGNSTELMIEARVIDRPDFTWTTNFTADRTRSTLAEWTVPCRIINTVNYICEGNNIRDIYGYHYLRSANELPTHLQPYADQFQVNDDGFLVWVGEGNTWRDGIAKELWGTSGTIEGRTFNWGYPVIDQDPETGTNVYQRIGQGDPDFQLGWMNTVTFGNFTASAHLHASVGGEIYNLTKHYNIHDGFDAILDQAGKSEETKKPIHYYYEGWYNGSIISDAFVEDASYLKLRQLSLTYRVPESLLGRTGLSSFGASRLEIGLVGRNLFSIDNYSGFDPEVVSSTNSRMAPVDYYVYPNTRNYTVSVGVTF